MTGDGVSRAGIIARADSTPWTAIVIVAFCLAPIFATNVYPFVDFYAHLVRYYVLAHMDDSAMLRENYQAAWGLLPNLGMDLIGVGLMKLFPPIMTGRIVALLTVALPFCGIVYLSFVLYRRVTTLTLALAGILAFNHILIWGFANFLLGLGIALIGLGLWIELRNRPILQFTVAAALAVALLFIHGLTFGLWGLLLGFIELNYAAQTRDLRLASLLRRGVRLAGIAVIPVLLFLQMPTAEVEGGVTVAISNFSGAVERGEHWPRLVDEVANRLDSFLRVGDTGVWPVVDRLLGVALWGLLALGFFLGGLKLDRRLWLAVACAGVLVAVMPPNLFGSGYISDRMPVLLLALVAAGVRCDPGKRVASVLLVCLLGLFLVRLSLTAVAWSEEGRSYQHFKDVLATNDTGQLAVAVRFTEQKKRRMDDIHPRCAPLESLLLLWNSTAVRTFAFPSQQPLRLAGPLAAARAAATDMGLRRARSDPAERTATLQGLAQAGFHTIVACDEGGAASSETPPGLIKIASERDWTLYRTAAAAGR